MEHLDINDGSVRIYQKITKDFKRKVLYWKKSTSGNQNITFYSWQIIAKDKLPLHLSSTPTPTLTPINPWPPTREQCCLSDMQLPGLMVPLGPCGARDALHGRDYDFTTCFFFRNFLNCDWMATAAFSVSGAPMSMSMSSAGTSFLEGSVGTTHCVLDRYYALQFCCSYPVRLDSAFFMVDQVWPLHRPLCSAVAVRHERYALLKIKVYPEIKGLIKNEWFNLFTPFVLNSYFSYNSYTFTCIHSYICIFRKEHLILFLTQSCCDLQLYFENKTRESDVLISVVMHYILLS